jgi:YHS domain-containing protein
MQGTLKRMVLAAAATALTATPVIVRAEEPRELYDGDVSKLRVLVNRDDSGLALQGYDPVAYFTEGRAVVGDSRYRARYKGAGYHFASEENRRAFESDPARYEPQYGGYCGYAASIDKLSPIDPEFFQVLDGRLILQHNQKAWDLWNKDVPRNIVKADRNWPGLVERNGSGGRVLVNVSRGVALKGRDPVAYVVDGRAVMGRPDIEAVFDGAKYHFASKENKDTFEESPARYAPAFGGYCAYAASVNKLADIDPEVFQILDGRLLLQHSRDVHDKFNKSPERNLAKADRNWPKLIEKHGS